MVRSERAPGYCDRQRPCGYATDIGSPRAFLIRSFAAAGPGALPDRRQAGKSDLCLEVL